MELLKFFALSLPVPLITSFIVGVIGIQVINEKIDQEFKMYVYCLGLTILIVFLSGIGIFTPITYTDKSYMLKLSNNIFTSLFHNIGAIWFLTSLVIPSFYLMKDGERKVNTSEILKKQEKKRFKIDKKKQIPFDYEKNIFISGTNGSGKTVAILKFIENRIKKNQFVLILDGKGDLGEFSLYDVVTKLAKQYSRPLYVINQTIPNETHAYNPFYNKNSTQIKDMLINMSEWSEEHYKALASEYWLDLIEYLKKYKIEITFNNICHYSIVDVWESDILKKLNEIDKNIEVIRERLNGNSIKTEQADLMLNDFIEEQTYLNRMLNTINRCGTAVSGAVSRLNVINKGVGVDLFSDNNTFSIEEAYDNNAVVLVILNSLQYTEYARSIGKLVIDDVKNLLGNISMDKTRHKPFLIVYDELNVYFSELMTNIINKARSLGGTNILSTQTVADMDIVSKESTRQMIGNMHSFYILKQNDTVSAELFADTFGTKKTINVTNVRKDEYGKTGLGTERKVDEYLINPSYLKHLPLEKGYWVDTQKERDNFFLTRVDYIDTSEMEEWTFHDLPLKRNINENEYVRLWTPQDMENFYKNGVVEIEEV